MAIVDLPVNHPRSSPLAGLLALVEIAEMGIVTQTADEMEAVFAYTVMEGSVREERVSHDEMGQLEQFLAVSLDDTDVVLRERLVAHLQLRGAGSLVCTQHHAVVGVDVYQSQSHDFQSVLYGTSTTRPETTDMRSLPACLADETRIDGYGLASAFTKEAKGKGDVQAKPVDALQAPASEVLTVALLCVLSVSAQLGEIYLSWYDHV